MYTVQPSPFIGQTTNWFLWKITWWNIQHKALCSLDVHYKLQFDWGVPVGWLWHVRLHALCFVWRRKLPQVRRRLLDMGHKLVYQNFDKNLKNPTMHQHIFPKLSEKNNQNQAQHKPDLEYSLLFQFFLQRGGNQPRFIQSQNEGKRIHSNVGCTGFLCTSCLTRSFYSWFIFSKWQIPFTRLLPI